MGNYLNTIEHLGRIFIHFAVLKFNNLYLSNKRSSTYKRRHRRGFLSSLSIRVHTTQIILFHNECLRSGKSGLLLTFWQE